LRSSASKWHAPSEHDRTILLEMALLWSRLAEHAMQSAASAARKEEVDPA
jgi:hypothetical protein